MAYLVSVPGVSWPALLACIVAIGVAGILRGFTGFGFGLAATPLLSLVLTPGLVVPVVLLLQVASSFVGFRQTVAAHDPMSTRWLTLSAMVTTPLGVWLLHHIGIAPARFCIALVTLAAVVVIGVGWRYHRAHGAGFILPFGLAAGVLSGLCAMPGPPVLAYYLGTGSPPASARASMILIFLITGALALATNLWVDGISRSILVLTALSVPLMVAGIIGGERLFRISAGRHYQSIGLVALSVIALTAALRASL